MGLEPFSNLIRKFRGNGTFTAQFTQERAGQHTSLTCSREDNRRKAGSMRTWSRSQKLIRNEPKNYQYIRVYKIISVDKDESHMRYDPISITEEEKATMRLRMIKNKRI